jgi:hypothetical protein
MKIQRKQIKIIAVLIIFTLLIVAYAYRVMAVNRKMPSAPVIKYDKGKDVEMGDDVLINYTMKGYSIKVNDAQPMTYKEFLKKYKVDDEYTNVPDKVYDVEVTIKNIDADSKTGINLNELYVQGIDVCASLDDNLLGQANPRLKGASAIALRKNSSFKVNLPFALFKYNFRSSVWNDLDNYDMNLVVTLYPTKKVIKL